jgi:hypothetical protein
MKRIDYTQARGGEIACGGCCSVPKTPKLHDDAVHVRGTFLSVNTCDDCSNGMRGTTVMAWKVCIVRCAIYVQAGTGEEGFQCQDLAPVQRLHSTERSLT